MDMQRVSFGRSLITDAEDAASIDFGRSSASVYALTDLRTPNLPPEYYASATGLHSSAQECSWIRSPSPLVLRGKQQKLSVLPELEPRMDSEAFSDYDSDSVSSAQEDHTPTLATLTEMPRNLFTHTASFVHTSERASAPGEARLAMDAMLNIWPKLCACRPGLAFDMNESLLYITSRRFLSSPEAGELSLELQGHRASQFLDILLCVLDRQLLRPNRENLSTRALGLMVKVALSTGCFPSTLFIHGVHAEANLTTGGGFADIYCGHWFGRRVAVKRLRIFPTDSDQRKMRATRILYRETLIWRALDHPNILPLYGIDDQVFAPFVCMISPWMEHGNIVQYIERCTPQPSTILRLICEVAAGVEYVHERGVVHGDLRGANVLIDSSSTRHHVRLTDFGLAAIAESTPSTRSGGSIRWMAPELLDPEFFGLTTSSRSQEADVFSFAMLCIEIYTQRPPFADTPSDGAVVLSVIRGKRPRRPTYQGHRVADDIWTIIKGCWQQHPGSRTPIGRAHEELLGIIPSHLLG